MALAADNRNEDTIAAVATAMAESGISIIRVSGKNAISAVSGIFRNKKGEAALSSYKAGTIHFGYIVDPGENDALIDEVMVSLMKAPHSYTTEDTVEINTHGGVYVTRKVLSIVLEQGIRLADPGEFTKRAFLGGRIDLSEAEAVMNLISSQNEFSRRTALLQLEGSVSDNISHMRSDILYELAFIESALDDPENYSTEGYPVKLRLKLVGIIHEMDRILSDSADSMILRNGIRTVIIGKPNAGKSSLLNFLCRSERAIVTDVAGTTRDTLEESVMLGDISLDIVDTAGIRETEDTVERIGVDRARREAGTADLILLLLDSSLPLSKEDEESAEILLKGISDGRKGMILLNKTDKKTDQNVTIEDTINFIRSLSENLSSGVVNSRDNSVDGDSSNETLSDECSHSSDKKTDSSSLTASRPANGITIGETFVSVLAISLKTGAGTDKIRETVSDMFHVEHYMSGNEVLLSGERQNENMREARKALELVIQSIDSGMSEDFYSIDLMSAYSALGRILGVEVEDDLADEIFSRFCLGK